MATWWMRCKQDIAESPEVLGQTPPLRPAARAQSGGGLTGSEPPQLVSHPRKLSDRELASARGWGGGISGEDQMKIAKLMPQVAPFNCRAVRHLQVRPPGDGRQHRQ